MEISSDAKDLRVTIEDPRGKMMDEQSGVNQMRYHFAAYYEGKHQICITNQDSRDIAMFFSIQTGTAAIDYTNII